MKNNDNQPYLRRPYHKPLLEKVKLVTDEAVLTTCKLGIPVGQGWGETCFNVIIIPVRCNQVGS